MSIHSVGLPKWSLSMMSGHMGPTSPLRLARTSNSPETCWNVFPLGLPFSYIYWQEHGWPSNEIHLETFITFEPWLWVGDVSSNLKTMLWRDCRSKWQTWRRTSRRWRRKWRKQRKNSTQPKKNWKQVMLKGIKTQMQIMTVQKVRKILHF